MEISTNSLQTLAISGSTSLFMSDESTTLASNDSKSDPPVEDYQLPSNSPDPLAASFTSGSCNPETQVIADVNTLSSLCPYTKYPDLSVFGGRFSLSLGLPLLPIFPKGSFSCKFKIYGEKGKRKHKRPFIASDSYSAGNRNISEDTGASFLDSGVREQLKDPVGVSLSPAFSPVCRPTKMNPEQKKRLRTRASKVYYPSTDITIGNSKEIIYPKLWDSNWGVGCPSGCARFEGVLGALRYKLSRSDSRSTDGHRASLSCTDASSMSVRELRVRNRNALVQFGSARGDGCSRYRDAKDALGIAFRRKLLMVDRSGIHSWGLFCLEAIYEHEFICFYVGELVSHRVAELRETIYKSIGT